MIHFKTLPKTFSGVPDTLWSGVNTPYPLIYIVFNQNSVSAGEAVEQGLAELVKEWKRGKQRNILPIMEFIMWALIKEEADKVRAAR